MEKELKKIFRNAKYKEDSDLAVNIWHNLLSYDKRVTRFKLWAFSFIGFTSLVGIIPVWKALLSDLTKSGLYEYLSLAFSNGGSAFLYWKELMYSIAESLPTMSIVLSLSITRLFKRGSLIPFPRQRLKV